MFFCGLAGKCYCHPPSRIGGKSTTMQIKGGFPKNYLTRFCQQFHVAFHTLGTLLDLSICGFHFLFAYFQTNNNYYADIPNEATYDSLL